MNPYHVMTAASSRYRVSDGTPRRQQQTSKRQKRRSTRDEAAQALNNNPWKSDSGTTLRPEKQME